MVLSDKGVVMLFFVNNVDVMVVVNIVNGLMFVLFFGLFMLFDFDSDI